MLNRWYDTPARHRDLFQAFFNDDFFQLGWTTPQPPRFIISENESAVIVRGDVPGMTHQDFSITAEGNTITVRGERAVEAPEGYRVIRRERLPLKFTRTFTLSRDMSLEAAEAKLENGVLTLTIPKRPEAQPRQIEVKVSRGGAT
jgi:HSP20 family protein